MWNIIKGWFGGSSLTAWLLVLALAGTIAGGWWGWSHGAASARAELEADYAAKLAEGYREAAVKQQEAYNRANALSMDVYNTRRELASARADITRRIAHAAASVPADCVFGPEFVGVWNDALGLPAAPGVPQGGDSGGAGGNATAAGPADAGVRGLAPVSAADLLAHIRDVGQWCRESAAVGAARLKLLEEAP
jgi:hypothetical protein